MNLYSAFAIEIFKCALQASDLWVRSDISIQLFRESLSRIKCTRQSRKVIWDMINTLFLTTVAVEPTFVTFLQHSQTYISGLPYDSFKFLWKTVHLKSPTIPFRIVACTFSDNLSQNSCIQAPLAAAISPLAISPSTWVNEIRPDHNTGRESRSLLFTNSVWVLLRPTVLWTLKGCETGPTVYSPYPKRLESLNHLRM